VTSSSLERFVPRVAAEWDLDNPGALYREIDGTLCFVDISGFTNLSEKLARRGRIGAEELTEVLDRVFGEMLRLAYDRGGSLLKFGGDALLLMFEGSPTSDTGDFGGYRDAFGACEMRPRSRLRPVGFICECPLDSIPARSISTWWEVHTAN
jgi:class 3 adenylate cyclase